jgi:hypothetical protein
MFVDDLHRDCFYDGICPLPRIEHRVKEAEGFLDKVKKMIGDTALVASY